MRDQNSLLSIKHLYVKEPQGESWKAIRYTSLEATQVNITDEHAFFESVIWCFHSEQHRIWLQCLAPYSLARLGITRQGNYQTILLSIFNSIITVLMHYSSDRKCTIRMTRIAVRTEGS